MADKTVVLITGANQGLGYQIVRALCRSDESYEILVSSRSLVKAQDAAKAAVNEFAPTKSRTWPIQVDIDDDTSISGAVHEVEAKFGRLDVLLNNAGAQYDPQFQAGHITMRQAWTLSWQTNTVGTQIMTASFIPLLLKSENPRLLFVTSGTSGLTGTENPNLPINVVPKKGWPKTGLTQQNNIPAYRSSKTGMNMMMREWYRMLKDDGVKVWCISPGFLATGLGGSQQENQRLGAGDPRLAADFVKTVVEGERDLDVGKVVTSDGIQPW